MPAALGAKVMGHATGDLLFLGVIALAPLGLLFAKRREPACVLGLWIVIHLFFTALADYGGPRFREPIEPVLFVLAACVVAGDWRWTSRRAWVGAAFVSVILALPAVRTLPYSLSSRADYGVGVWTATDTGRTASTTAGQAGFNLRSTREGIELRLWALPPSAAATPVEVRIDGVGVGDAVVDQNGRRLRYDGSVGQLHFVELAPKTDGERPRFGLELFDHAPGVGR